jgi:hypothetical protein
MPGKAMAFSLGRDIESLILKNREVLFWELWHYWDIFSGLWNMNFYGNKLNLFIVRKFTKLKLYSRKLSEFYSQSWDFL